jgi:hypothetical protein
VRGSRAHDRSKGSSSSGPCTAAADLHPATGAGATGEAPLGDARAAWLGRVAPLQHPPPGPSAAAPPALARAWSRLARVAAACTREGIIAQGHDSSQSRPDSQSISHDTRGSSHAASVSVSERDMHSASASAQAESPLRTPLALLPPAAQMATLLPGATCRRAAGLSPASALAPCGHCERGLSWNLGLPLPAAMAAAAATARIVHAPRRIDSGGRWLCAGPGRWWCRWCSAGQQGGLARGSAHSRSHWAAAVAAAAAPGHFGHREPIDGPCRLVRLPRRDRRGGVLLQHLAPGLPASVASQ